MLNWIMFFLIACSVAAVIRYAPILYGMLEGLVLDALGVERDATPWMGW